MASAPSIETDDEVVNCVQATDGSSDDLSDLRIAYLMNQHPMTSVSFVRREMLGMEQAGATVQRFSIRRWGDRSVDPADREEIARTEILLSSWRLILMDAVNCLFHSPRNFFKTLALTCKIGWKSDRGLPFYLMYFLEACRLRRRTKDRDTQWVHAHFGTNSATVAMLCRSLGGPPFSFTVHGPEEFDRPELLHLSTKIANAELVIAISKYGRSQLFRWARYRDWQKIQIVRCGISETFASPKPTPPTEEHEFVCVARLAEQKGLPILIGAAGELKRRGNRFHLSVIGDGAMRAELEHLIVQCDVTHEVSLLGWQSELFIRNAIERSRAMVLPSFAEGLPVVLMEALALERPVITTQIAGICELVRHGQNGWIVPAGDQDSLVVAMEAVLEASPDQLHSMGKHGALLVHERHIASVEGRRLGHLIMDRLGRSKSSICTT